MESSVDDALNAHISAGPPSMPYSMGEITPSVVFSATVSIVAHTTSRSLSAAVSRPTMRATCLRPASSPRPSAFSTPTASCARHRADSPIQLRSAMTISRGTRPSNPDRNTSSPAASAVRSTVDAVSHTALRRRFPPRARSRFSHQLIYFPMTHTG